LSHATNKQQAENVLVCFTSVRAAVARYGQDGRDVQAISCSPFQFMYSLDPELGRKTARAINENLAAIVQVPESVRRAGRRPAAGARRGAESWNLRQASRFRGRGDRTNVAGREILAGRDVFWAKVQALDVMVFMHPNGFTAASDCRTTTSSTSSAPARLDRRDRDLVFDGILEKFPKLKIGVRARGRLRLALPGARWTTRGAPASTRAQCSSGKPRQSLAKLYFDTIVFDREQLRHLVNLWGADHIVVGNDYPYDMGWYDPRGFVDGCTFLKDADKARIMGSMRRGCQDQARRTS